MATDTRIGTELAGYRIESLLGRGGMSVVYLAEDTRLKRKAALKLLASDLAADEGFRQRFISESELAASLDHPNVIPIFEAGEADGVLYIAMRYVKTTDLKALIKSRGTVETRRALAIVAQTASALDAAAQEGLVHRDVKPGNILVAEGQGAGGTDHVYLSDFGLTKRQQAPTGLTRTGQFVGTVDYVAPEQIEGKPIDGRTDQYALACVLYECLTGHAPFPKDAETAVLIAHLMEAPPRITAERPDLPAAIDHVLAKAMAKVKEDRYADCTTFVRGAAEALGEMPAGTAGPSMTLPGTTFQPAPPTFQAPAGPYQPAPTFTPGPAPPVAPPMAPGRGKRKTALLVGAVVAVAAIAAVIGVLVLSGGSNKNPPSSGPVSFADDFSNTTRWDTGDTAGSKLSYVNGQYEEEVKAGPFAAGFPKAARLAQVGDVSVQVDAKAVSGGHADNGFGVACRATTNTLAYYVVIGTKGVYAFEKSDGANQPILKSGTSPQIQKGAGHTNTVLATCTGGENDTPVVMQLFVNGVLVDQAEDTPQVDPTVTGTDSPGVFPRGKVGLVAVGAKGLDVLFDNFEANSPPKVPKQ